MHINIFPFLSFSIFYYYDYCTSEVIMIIIIIITLVDCGYLPVEHTLPAPSFRGPLIHSHSC